MNNIYSKQKTVLEVYSAVELCRRLSLSLLGSGSGCVTVSASGWVRGSNTNIWKLFLPDLCNTHFGNFIALRAWTK